MLLGGFQGKGLCALGMVTAQTPSPPLICVILIPFFRPSMSKRKDIPGIMTYTRQPTQCKELFMIYFCVYEPLFMKMTPQIENRCFNTLHFRIG